jgi:hypothetical protein
MLDAVSYDDTRAFDNGLLRSLGFTQGLDYAYRHFSIGGRFMLADTSLEWWVSQTYCACVLKTVGQLRHLMTGLGLEAA